MRRLAGWQPHLLTTRENSPPDRLATFWCSVTATALHSCQSLRPWRTHATTSCRASSTRQPSFEIRAKVSGRSNTSSHEASYLHHSLQIKYMVASDVRWRLDACIRKSPRSWFHCRKERAHCSRGNAENFAWLVAWCSTSQSLPHMKWQ